MKDWKRRWKEEGNSKIRMNENADSLHIVPNHPLRKICPFQTLYFQNVHVNQEASYNWKYYKHITSISLWRLGFPLQPFNSQVQKNFTHSTVLINRSCWFQETFFFKSILVIISLLFFFFFSCIKFRIKNIKAASTSDLTFRESMWQGSPW